MAADTLEHEFPLFDAIALAGIVLKNRLVLSPMCTYSARDGQADYFHLAHIAKFPAGGFGLVFTEAAAVTKDGRITHGDLGIWEDDQIPGQLRMTRQIHANGAKAGMQLAHAGRKSSMQRPWDGNGPLDEREKLLPQAGYGGWPHQYGWWLERRKKVLAAANLQHD